MNAAKSHDARTQSGELLRRPNIVRADAGFRVAALAAAFRERTVADADAKGVTAPDALIAATAAVCKAKGSRTSDAALLEASGTARIDGLVTGHPRDLGDQSPLGCERNGSAIERRPREAALEAPVDARGRLAGSVERTVARRRAEAEGCLIRFRNAGEEARPEEKGVIGYGHLKGRTRPTGRFAKCIIPALRFSGVTVEGVRNTTPSETSNR